MYTVKSKGVKKMNLEKNISFRKKNLRGAKIEDLYFFVEKMKVENEFIKVEDVKKYIELKFDYEPKQKERV